MKEFINKLIESFLGECVIYAENYEKALNIANELTEEYNNGWIPCSERLPEKNQRCIFSYNGNINSVGIEGNYVDIDTFDGKRFRFFGIDRVIAWQPLPAPYKEGVTENE